MYESTVIPDSRALSFEGNGDDPFPLFIFRRTYGTKKSKL